MAASTATKMFTAIGVSLEWAKSGKTSPPDSLAIKVNLTGEVASHGRKLPLKKLVYGPTLRGERTNFEPDYVAPLERTLRWFLERYGYHGVDVVPSEIPYRL
jgi:hypothetical protein